MLLHDFLRASVERAGYDRDKDLVNALEERLAKHESIKATTVKTHVSKLLTGTPQAREFFLDPKHPHRLAELCDVLGIEASDVQRWVDQTVLVVDPRLPEDALVFLRDRQASASAAFEVVVPAPGADPRAAARDCAHDHRNAVVVMVAKGDVEYFSGASVNAALLKKVPRGWLVAGHEGLYELPPPPPPVLFDADGAVRVPVAGSPWFSFVRDALHGDDYAIREAIADGLSPTISLKQAVDWLQKIPWKKAPRAHGDDRYDRHDIFVRHPDLSKFPAFPTSTRIWEHQGRVYATGEDAARFAELLAPYHRVLTPTWPEDHEAVLPIFSDPWTALEAIKDESDLAVVKLLDNMDAVGESGIIDADQSFGTARKVLGRTFVKERLVTTAKHALDATTTGSHVPNALNAAGGPARIPAVDEAAGLRARVQHLLDHGAEPTPAGFALLRVLQLALTNPLIILDCGDKEPHFFVDLGAGQRVEIRTSKLNGARRALQFVGKKADDVGHWPLIWGGDVLVKVFPGHSAILQGVVAVGPAPD